MPIEYVTDRTGKVVPKGALGFGQAVVPERPPAPRAKAKPKPTYSPPPVWGLGQNGLSLGKLVNDLRYEAKQLVTDPLRSVERASRTTMGGTVPGILFSQGSLGATQATANAVRAGVEWKQRSQGRKQTDYTTSPAGRAVDRVVDHVYTSFGATPPSQMTADQKAADDMRSAMTLGLAGGVGLQLGLKALSGVRFVGPAAQALATAMDPSKAQTLAGGLARIGFDAAVSEAATSPFDYTATGGSAAGLVDMVLGTKIDPVKPGMAFPDAAAAAFAPNVAFAAGLGGLFMGINRARAGRRVVQQVVEQPRAELQAAGLTQADPETGAAAFTPEAIGNAPSSLRDVNAALEEKYGIKTPEPEPEAAAPAPVIPSQPMQPGGAVMDGELPTADPGLDPWAIDYDPTLPEADVALSQIKNASDAELLDAVRSGGPVLNTLDEQMATRQPLAPDPSLSTDLNAAPSDRLAAPITSFAKQWQRIGQKEPQQLLNVLHPEVNPDLADRAQAMFGKQWEQLTPADAVETLQAAANDGATVIPSRLLPGQQIMRTADLKIAPDELQYKGNVDADGVQLDGSLKGVDLWNTDMEGVIEVWQNPKDGNYYVANGHNRFALAQEKGIPSLLVKELIAETPEEAKTAAALSNIASGGGKPIDAARFIKGMGVTDPAQLEAMGLPLRPDSGHGLSGFQLSQLPDDILRAVESGQIKERMGRIIGGSGADEASMRGAYRYLVENTGVTEGRLRNMLEMSRQMTGKAQAGGGGDQIDLLKDTPWDQTFNKQMIAVADLADEVGTLLKREKRLFTMADANSAALEAKGSRIDKASAQAVADANARAIDFFQRTWMETGPIRDLLNEGGARVANGENKGAVAKQIKNRLVGQLGDLMGEQAVTRTDVVQEDLMAQAPQQLDELLPDDRQAMEMLAIQRAIQNGEVRPPETPIPELPTDSGVDLLKVQRDLAENTISDDVVQAMADELDLRAAQKAMDDAMAQEAEKAAREAEGYDLLTFDEKKQAGAVDGFVDPPPGSAAAKRRAEEIAALESQIRDTEQSRIPGAEAVGRTEFAAELRAHAAKLRKQLEEMTGQGLAAPTAFTFPADLSKSAPRYGMAQLAFASDLDRAAYMLRDVSKKSKGEDRLVTALQEAGYSVQAIRTHGAKVNKAIKELITAETGSAAAPQKAMKLQVPDQGMDLGELQSPAGWDSVSNDPFESNPEMRARRQEELTQIIREVAGDEVAINFQDGYTRKITSAEWGGDGKKTSFTGGFYRLRDDLIQINGILREDDASLARVAYHEAFHRLQFIALGPKEAAVLNGRWARIKVGIGSGHLDKTPIAYAESQAVAFMRYAGAKRNGQDPIRAMLGSYEFDTDAATKAVNIVVSAFDRIFDVFEKLYNGITKGTFDSTRGIFERARRGALADIEGWEGAGGDVAAGSGMEMMSSPTGWRRESWWGESTRKNLGGEMQSPALSRGALVDELTDALGDTDPRTGLPRGLSRAASKALFDGDPSRALTESVQLAETRLADLNTRIEAVKQRAAMEGC